MKPPTPPEVEEDNQELPAEGMMFVGDQGKIRAGFRCEHPRLIPERKSREFQASPSAAGALSPEARHSAWVKAFQGGAATEGDFLLAGPISEAFNLAAISLRLGGKRLVWDSANLKITNRPEANQFLGRAYRKGWELPG